MIAFNILFPPVCYACHRRLDATAECLCPDCFAHLKRQKRQLLGEIKSDERYFYSAVALYYYDYIMRQLLHLYKFKGIRQIGKYFANIAVEILSAEYPVLLKVDGTVAVPMLKSAERQRGFNQAAFLCELISDRLGLKDYSDKVVKTVITTRQSLKNFDQRMHSPDDIYKLKDPECFKNKTILVIDDIFTTGATANILSKFLMQNGANRVYIFVIASGNHPLHNRTINRQQKAKKVF